MCLAYGEDNRGGNHTNSRDGGRRAEPAYDFAVVLLVHDRVLERLWVEGAEAPSTVGESVHCGDGRRTPRDGSLVKPV